MGAELVNAVDGVDSEVECKYDEHKHKDDLEGETCNHYIVAELWILVLMRPHGCDTTPCSLQDQRDEVAGDEDDWVKSRTDTGVLGPKDADDVGEAEVDASSKEGRCDSETYDLDEEG
jgi:hypothetical protein